MERIGSAVTWSDTEFASYDVTGVDVRGRRFKRSYDSWFMAGSINLWRGTVWGVKHDGTRVAIRRVYN